MPSPSCRMVRSTSAYGSPNGAWRARTARQAPPAWLAWLAAGAVLAAAVPAAAAGAPPSGAAYETAAQLPAPRLTAVAGSTRLELPSGETVALALPPGARLETAAALAGGWIAAGTTPTFPAGGGGSASELLLLVGSAAGAVGQSSSGTAGQNASGATAQLPSGTAAGSVRGSQGAPGTRGEGSPMAAAAAAAVPPPAGRTGRLRAEPLPLIEDGRLAGMVWLEGDDSRALGVRYAGWSGAAWSAPQTISAPGQGSQLALTAARLAGGSWLLAWSAFDGHDDEIVWSVRSAGVNGAWTPPRRLTDNEVPDITPALAASGSGAVIAWNQLAGDGYHLLVARFQDGRWSAPATIGPAGWLYPSFEAAPHSDRLRLLVRAAQPRGWTAIELDTAGRPLRLAEIPEGIEIAPGTTTATGTAPGRPVLLAGSAGGAAFAWAAGTGQRTTPWRPWPAPAASAGSAAGTAGLAGIASGEATLAGRAVPTPAPAPRDASAPVYIAFGDSITAGFGDPKGIGYPGRLESLLSAAQGVQVTVVNEGLFGETTAEGLSRLGSVLQPGATAILLMEGTNDIGARVSVDTIVQNLDTMADRAEAAGITAVHATVIPRLPGAEADTNDVFTASLGAGIRELAWEKSRELADPFEVFFFLTPDALTMDYLGGGDKLHPNSAGYDLLAQTFFDLLTGVDAVPPVPGAITPGDKRVNVSAGTAIALDLYDFGAGIDIANTRLLLDGQPVATIPTGNKSKLSFFYQPPAPIAGVVTIGVQTRDLATPPNAFTGTLSSFEVVGTTFLPGDINLDGIVDGEDLLLLAYCFGAHRFNSNFQLDCDLNGDGVIDGLDLAILAANFGKRSF